MNLHFVCTGNVFRSRLAEAYAKYLLKNHPQFTITSSGVNANHGENGPIAWYALKIIADNDLLDYISPFWVQTTASTLDSQDKIIFIEPWHQEQCRLRFDYHKNNYETWDVTDIQSEITDEEIIEFSQTQFEKIKVYVTKLVNSLIPG